MNRILAVGIDAAFSNMGFAQVEITLPSLDIRCLDLSLATTEGEKGKQVRKSSSDLRRAQELHAALQLACEDMRIAFAEVPSGAQSAAAAKALGMATGILASCPIPLIEVSPMEVKVAVTGSRKIKATKPQIIAWAMKRWPKAPWVLHKHGGKTFKKGDPQNCNEHLADALAIVVAGIDTPAFKNLLAMNHATSSTPDHRPAPRGRRVVLL